MGTEGAAEPASGLVKINSLWGVGAGGKGWGLDSEGEELGGKG